MSNKQPMLPRALRECEKTRREWVRENQVFLWAIFWLGATVLLSSADIWLGENGEKLIVLRVISVFSASGVSLDQP